jgi:two-component system sensor histidine kinase YesM
LASPTSGESSYGIQNVNERIKLYYGAEYGLSYDINKGITVAKIIIPAVE